jgi:hypothetical protein
MYGETDTLNSRNTVTSHLRTIAHKGRPVVDIALNDGAGGFYGNYISSFTTGDRIEGEVSIIASTDQRFDDIQITFEGKKKKKTT